MKVKISKHLQAKVVLRLKKKMRIRKKVAGTVERPRLCVFRSSKHLYAQLIDDVKGTTLVSASTLDLNKSGVNKSMATEIGTEIAKRAIAKGFKSVVFDRNGYLYHGRIKSLADGARNAGLQF